MMPAEPPPRSSSDLEKGEDPEKPRESRMSIVGTSRPSSVSTLEIQDGAPPLPGNEVDLGLQLTCSLRSGMGRRELELEKPPDGGFQAWIIGMLMDDCGEASR